MCTVSTSAVGPIVSCRGCRAPIRFVRLTSGERFPVDADPQRVLILDGAVGAPRATLVDERGVIHRGVRDVEGALPVEGYAPHWASCPDANRFRKGREERAR